MAEIFTCVPQGARTATLFPPVILSCAGSVNESEDVNADVIHLILRDGGRE